MANITFNLSPESIDDAIRQVEAFQKSIERKQRLLMIMLVDRCVVLVKEELEELVYSQPGEEYRTNALMDSIEGYYDADAKKGYVFTDLPYAPYVEFGTGVMGASKPRPEASKHGWEYDVNRHGRAGWTYYNERTGTFITTIGFESRPFMYNALRRLEQEVPKFVKEVFG